MREPIAVVAAILILALVILLVGGWIDRHASAPNPRVWYVYDSRTALCFAMIQERVTSLATVPCDAVPAALLGTLR